MSDALAAALGWSTQLAVAPAAVTASNGSVALDAVQRQLASILSALGAEKDTTNGVAAPAAAAAVQARPGAGKRAMPDGNRLQFLHVGPAYNKQQRPPHPPRRLSHRPMKQRPPTPAWVRPPIVAVDHPMEDDGDNLTDRDCLDGRPKSCSRTDEEEEPTTGTERAKALVHKTAMLAATAPDTPTETECREEQAR